MINIGDITFGPAWKYSDDVLAVAVPIIKNVFPKRRSYKVLEEVKNDVNVEDTGSISKLEINSNVDEPVFVRGGTMFEGKGTQSRSPVSSIVIEPNSKKIPIEVRCIHASHGISAGSSFSFAGFVPHEVEHNLMSNRSQGEVWASVKRYSLKAQSLGSTGLGKTFGADNLVANVEEVNKFKGKVSDIISKLPAHKNQVGLVILDFNGVVGFELFDHPDSWKAISSDIIKKYSDVLTQKPAETSLFKLDEEQMLVKIKEFMKRLIDCKKDVAFENNVAKTFLLTGDKIAGEYTTINEVVIHLLGFRKEKELEREEPRTSIQPFHLDNWRPRTSPILRYWMISKI